MKALLIHEFGDPKQLKLEEVPTPEPGGAGDDVLVAVKGASINPSDVKNVAGKMHGTVLPRIPGRDFAGVIVRGPAELVGREVWGTGGDISRTRDGSHAQFILLPKSAVAFKPAALPMEAAAASGLSFVTAWEAMVTVAAVAAGEMVVIFGATGGVGSAAVQIAKAKGARVIGIIRSESDGPSVRQDGADEVVNSRSAGFVDAIRTLTQGNGAQVVFDASGMMFGEAIEAAALDGRVPIVAAPPDGVVSFNLRTLYRKMLKVHGIDTLRLNAVACAQRLSELAPGFESRQFRAKPGRPMPLSAAGEAYGLAAGGGGRIILQP